MARKKRIWHPNYFYHIVSRGNRRDALFKDDGDYSSFMYILQKVHDNYPFEIASYCFMTNHYHFQLRSKIHPISKLMQQVNKRYADYFNTKYNLTGHVFEKRYYSNSIVDRKGMLEVSRYIHLNPVHANVVQNPEDYHWSSYRYFQGSDTPYYPYINPELLQDCFTGPVSESKKMYCWYVKKELEKMHLHVNKT